MDTKLKLSTAQAGWNQGEHDNKWYVKTPEGEVLFVFENKFDEKTAMEAIHLGRKFELEAFHQGVDFGKETQKAFYENKILQLEHAVKVLGDMNEQLSEKLETIINAET